MPPSLVSTSASTLPAQTPRPQPESSDAALQRAERVISALLPGTPPSAITSVQAEASRYRATRQYAAAESLYQNTVARLQNASGSIDDQAIIYNDLGTLYMIQERFQEAEEALQQALNKGRRLTSLEPHTSVNRQHLGEVHFNLGTVASRLRRDDEAEKHYQQTLKLWTPEAPSPSHSNKALLLNQLAALYTRQGRFREAEQFYAQALSMSDQEPQIRARNLRGRGELAYHQRHFEQAQHDYQEALRLWQQHSSATDPEVGRTYSYLATIHYEQAQYPQAEDYYKRALQILQAALGPAHQDVARTQTNLATLYYTQRRFDLAENLYLSSLGTLEQKLGASHPEVQLARRHLAAIAQEQGNHNTAEELLAKIETAMQDAPPLDRAAALMDQGRHYENDVRYENRHQRAKLIYQKALRIRQALLPANHPDIAKSYYHLAEVAQAMGSGHEARQAYQQALEIQRQVLADAHPDLAATYRGLAALDTIEHRYAQAEVLHHQALRGIETSMGKNHPDIAVALGHLASLAVKQKQFVKAQQLYQQAQSIMLNEARLNREQEGATQGRLAQQKQGLLTNYAWLLSAFTKPAAPKLASFAEAAEDLFVVVEQLRAGRVQEALAQAGARATIRNPGTAKLAQTVEVLRESYRTVRLELTQHYSRATTEQNRQATQRLHARREEIDHHLRVAADQLYREAPQYGELVAPTPITMTSVAELLQPDEALVSFFALPDQLLSWLVRRGQPPVFRSIDLSRDVLLTRIQRVRDSLDQAHNIANDILGPVDVEGAYDLYDLLVAPLRPALHGVTHLLIVPDVTLLSFPFGAMITRADSPVYRQMKRLYAMGRRTALSDTDISAYADLPWLAREFAMTVLPSATSLRAMRHEHRLAGQARQPLIGFGAPELRKTSWQRDGSKGSAEDPALEAIRGLSNLPGAKTELIKLADALGADRSTALYLGSDAKEATLRRLNTTGQLSQAKVLAFATHGLLQHNQIPNLTQPALVLTPPEVASSQDDGLLRMDEILDLHLPHTDWVILSACNTAAGDGSGEGLSGLARSFLFTGARAVLASLWNVDDDATQVLMVEIFKRYSRLEKTSRAEALRQGVQALLKRSREIPYWAHPYAWGPFILVGEGR